MAGTKNKIWYGLKNVHYAICTENADGSVTYGTPAKWPGAVNITLSPEGSQDNFYADDIIYEVLNSNQGYTGSFESASIPDEVLLNVFSQVKDATTGLTYETSEQRVKYIALMFEFNGDQLARRHVLYRVMLNRANLDGSTVEQSKTPKTQTVDLKATARADGLVKAYADPGDASYEDFYKEVKEPTVQVAAAEESGS